jgi:hypothetical protein
VRQQREHTRAGTKDSAVGEAATQIGAAVAVEDAPSGGARVVLRFDPA